MDSESETPLTNQSDNATISYANKTTSTLPTTIRHKKSAIITLDNPKQELQLYSSILRDTKIKPHAIIQINNEAPYQYQITFENEKQYLQSLPQTIKIRNQSFKFNSLAAVRIQISILRVDAELEDKEVDLAFVKFGKITNPTKKLYKNINETEKVQLGCRILTLELSNADILPPNSIFLSPGMQSQVIFTLPGSTKTNQQLAFEEREKRREEKRKREEEKNERLEQENIRALNNADTQIVERDHNPEKETIPAENPTSSPPSHQQNTKIIPPNADASPKETDIVSTQAVLSTLETEACSVCKYDLCEGFLHTQCGTQSDPQNTDDLLPVRNCKHGIVKLRDQFKKYEQAGDVREFADAISYILSKCHSTYIKSIADNLGLANLLTPVSIARIVLLSASEPVPDNSETVKIHQDIVQAATFHHPSVKRAMADEKLLPNRESVKVQLKPMLSIVTSILNNCIHVLTTTKQ